MSPVRPLLLVSLLVSAVLAGCVGDDGIDGSTNVVLPDVETFALPRLVQDHAHHTEHQAHVGSIGFETLGFAAARTEYPAGEVYFEMAVRGDYAYVVFGPKDGNVAPGVEAGFFVYDVSNPTQPRQVGKWLGQPPSDIEVSADGDFVFFSTQRNGYPYPYTFNAEAGVLGHAPRGTYIVDVSEKTAPTTVAFMPLPTNGPHTLSYARLPDGEELILASTYDILFTAYPQNVGQNVASQKVVIHRFEREPSPHFVPLSVFQIVTPDEGDATYFPHDATLHIDPATDRVIMDVAYWGHGLVTVDITDPTEPKELARFADTAPSAYVNTHLVRVFPGTIDGKVVAVLEPEIPSGTDAGQFTFVDITDPAKPQKLGYWALPGEHIIDKPFIFSPHNFDVACGGKGQAQGYGVDYGVPCEDPTMVLSHFHGGLWILDAADPTQPKATGFFFPNVTRTDMTEKGPFTGFVTTFIQDGIIYAPEAWTGLYVLKAAQFDP